MTKSVENVRGVLTRVHDFLGILIREDLVKDAPFLGEGELENVSDLADDVWDAIKTMRRITGRLNRPSHMEGMDKKYELTDETREFREHTLHRIRALRDFGDVKAGDLGGWIESEDNLFQNGNCWVSGDAMVYDNAWVSGNAKIYGRAWVFDTAHVSGTAEVFDSAEVCGDAEVYGYTKVYDHAVVCDRAWVSGNTKISGEVRVSDNVMIYDYAQVCDYAQISDNAQISGNAKVCGDAKICGDAKVCGDAVVKDNTGYTLIKNFWSSGRCITYTCSNKMWTAGCFHGTGEELIKKAYVDSEEKGKCYEAFVKTTEMVYDMLEKRN